ncbi:replication-relaxation family protein [Jatrophihabitans lederbergiae]|uniref:Replication-relaxation family protein n=1 Tax=Jatrophihabitans lederbergiae TaxID=3075547 RepID=A0ABU2JFL6_9ACTN|nr:replication-relaxation family protein [Jatrophihabitans sp. DSM 44399]MDT0263765.1 replication-relaxation family protein [Jatrophihabitans sp. DSM 44399]
MNSYPAPQRDLRGHRPPRASDRAALTGEHHAYLAAHLTPRDRWLARVLAEHRVLTAAQIAQLAFASTRGANRRLLSLYRWRVVDRFQPYLTSGSAPMHYVLDTAGAAALAAEDGIDTSTKDLGYRHDRAIRIAHSLRLAHTVGVNGFFADLVAVARHSPEDRPGGDGVAGGSRAVTAWWSEARCGRLFGEHVRPDAYGRWREPSDGRTSEVEFFLEYDTGTEALSRVAGKLTGYQRLAAATGIPTPVLFWMPTPTREANARTALSAVLRGLDRPDLVPVATTSAIALGGDRDGTRCPWAAAAPDSPAGARWLPLTPSTTPGAPNSVARVRLAQLAQVWPHAAPPAPAGPSDTTPAHRPGTGLTPPAPMPPATGGWPTHTGTAGADDRAADR